MKKIFDSEIEGSKESLRIATPTIVAKYRAKRLACNKIVDLCAGIGGQTIEFAKTCKEVIAVEKGKEEVNHLRENTKLMKNVTIIEDDAFSEIVVKELNGADVYFCDPSRPLEEEKRSIESITPNPQKLSGVFENIAIEFPPQLTPDKIPFKAEKEYLSVDGKLNRLTLYFGNLQKAEVSVVSLPSETRLTNKSTKANPTKTKLGKFLYEVDTAVIKAGLLPNLIGSLKIKIGVYSVAKYTLLSSKDYAKSPFLRAYVVVSSTKPDNASINEALLANGYGKAVIHARIIPEDYWKLRNDIEKGLSGYKTAHVFINQTEGIITKQQQ
ncbi:MAG: class I SAM-dependent methyltransferase [Nanoarchaeota archaeon]